MTAEMNTASGMLERAQWSEAIVIPQLLEGIGHAILALAEQQQLANRIALAEHMRATDAMLGRTIVSREGVTVWQLPETEHADLGVLVEIKELLR